MIFENGCPQVVPYSVFFYFMRFQLEFFLCRPQTLESMKTVEGVSEVWLQKYGDKFLETIGNFCGTRDVDFPMDAHLSAASTRPQSAPTIVKVC